jgi:hypothetical protein
VGEGRRIEKENSISMKTRKIIVEVICLVLMLNFFYEGIYKVAYWSNYAFWVKHAPLLRSIWQILTYVIPMGEIALALGFMVPKFRMRALYISIACLFVFVLWVMGWHLFTSRIFWPYHALWEKPTWMQKMLISLGMGWLALTAIVMSSSVSLRKGYNSHPVQNKPVNAS